MADRKPSDDLKEGLFLLYKAARGAAKEIDSSKVEQTLQTGATKVEKTIQSGARELARVIGNVGKTLSGELEKTFSDKDSPPDDQGPGGPPPARPGS